MTIVFLSSTSKDLSRYREAVYRAIEGLDGFHCIRMEDFGARDNTAEEFCRQKIAECELVVCLVGLCFGSPAPGSDESYTILEYRAANTASIPRLVFVSAEEDENLRYYPGYYRESDEKWNKQQAFRQEAGNGCIRETFIEPDDLARKVVAAIRNWEHRRENHPITQPDYFKQRAPHLGVHTQFFDNILCLYASLADLDLEKVRGFLSRDLVQRQQDFHPGRSVQDQLIGLELLRESHPTYGALLCFGSNLQAWLPSASIHCFEWRGNMRHEGWSDDWDCRGDLLEQFANCLDFLRKHLRFSRVISSEGRKEQYEIPIEALQEAIANALVHREYARRENNEYVGREGCIQVEVYRNRIEIKSPGLLPPQMTIEALETIDTTHPRNPLIARIFYLCGLVERAGSGIQRMRYAMENAGLPPPRFEPGDAQTFKVILERPQQVPEEILVSDEFGSLLKQGLEEIATRENKSLENTITDISILSGKRNPSLIQKWVYGHIPTSDQIALLAQACIQTGGMSEIWLRIFLKAAHYTEIDSLTAVLNSGPNSFTKVSQIWNVPYRRNPFFTGREAILQHLHRMLTVGDTAALTQSLAISGLGGIGKTQTAVEYAYRYRNEYRAVLWAKADTPETLNADLLIIAMLLNLPEKDAQDQALVVPAVKRWLSEQRDWLLILDNADDLTLVRDLLPPVQTGRVLLTTRAHALGRMTQRIELDTMDRTEGAQLLLRRANLLAAGAPSTAASEADRATAEALVQELGGLPLALDQAGAYIEETNCSLSQYLSLYQTRRASLLKRRGGLVDDHPQPVAKTWSLSFERVEQANPLASELLRFCAFLYPEDIPEDLITQNAAQLGPVLQAIGTEPLALGDALAALLNYSLMRRAPEKGTLSMHRLVQAVLKDNMDRATQRQWAERAVLAVERSFPPIEVETWPACQLYLPHALVCAAHIAQWDLATTEAAGLLFQAGYYLDDRGHYEQAEPLYQRALATFERVLGPEHPSTLSTVNSLVNLYAEQGKYEQAEPLYQRALATFERVLGPEHPSTLSIVNNLANLYAEQGKYEQAEPLYQRALATFERVLGPEHPSTLSIVNNLAVLYRNQGKYEQAEPLYQRALTTFERVLGLEHPDTAKIQENYTDLLQKMKKGTQATNPQD